MRAACLIAITLVMVTSARADGPRTVAIGFDHNVHDRDIVVSGVESLPCTRCHAMKNGALVGRPDHGSCFGACHGAAPPRIASREKPRFVADQIRVCTTCHAEAALLAVPGTKATLAVPFPPYAAADFALLAPHKVHRAIACAQCHLAKPTAPHRRCAGCHDGAPDHGKPMTTCLGCHTPGSGQPEPPRLRILHNTVSSTFSHPRHAVRGGGGAQCATCHAAILDTDDSILPRPGAAACGVAGCHDGKPTFAITEACTKCHSQAPSSFEVSRTTARFSHTTAGHQDGKLACTTCHPVGKTGEALVAGHAACASCHADDFGKREPTICGACHNATEPWRPLVVDRLPPERTEFGATLDHGTHPGACTSCHSLTTSAMQLRPARGHRACSTAGCHAIAGGPAPQLGACDGCHAIGLADKRVAQRMAPPWSVRARFDHAPHQHSPDGAALACTACHDKLDGAGLLEMPAPAKARCEPCHDGAIAFKLTGTTCTRCHAGAR